MSTVQTTYAGAGTLNLNAEKKLMGAHIIVAVLAVTVGSLFGPLQAAEHAGVNLYPYLKPLLQSYYQGLTLHGILNALVFTTFFITGFHTLLVARGLERPMRSIGLSWLGFFVMLIGLLMAAVPLLLNLASVLYTMYPPMAGPWYFYLGMTLVVVGSWICGWSMIFTYFGWRKDNPGVKTPFIALGSLINMVLWQVCTLGIAAEILGQIIPMTLGWVNGIDVQLARTLFWFTGHPLVYFWLLPAYLAWYALLPKQAGGKMFSEPLARLAFWMFLILSTPLGFHHQYADPGIPAIWKFLHAALTFGVFIPSLLTAFTAIASLEGAARNRGGKGLLMWVFALPWGDPSFTAQAFAMLIFAFGGMGGLINASFNLNLIVHNTAWIPGHLHLTVGSGVTLTFFGIMYWLVPHITGRALFSKGLGLAQAWTWLIGMAIFSEGMHQLGIRGAPRRTMLGIASENYGHDNWYVFRIMCGVGGAILLISLLCFVVNMLGSWLLSSKKVDVEIPVADSSEEDTSPALLDNWKPWLAVMGALIVIAYGPMLFQMIQGIQALAQKKVVW